MFHLMESKRFDRSSLSVILGGRSRPQEGYLKDKKLFPTLRQDN